MSKDNLKKYLKALAQNPKLKAQHEKDPIGTMQQNGVDKKHQDMIMSGDTDGVKREIGSDESCLIMINATFKN